MKVLPAEMWSVDPRTADRLNVKPSHPVFRVRRLRLADAQPLALETAVVSFAGCERLLDEDLAHSSLYQLLETKYKLPLLAAEQEVEAGLTQEDEAELLGLGPGDPVLRTRRVTYSERGRPVEYATAVYRGDKYTFYTRIVRDGVAL
ncbi:MAG: GntR family transcriptional regulator [Chloroflexota bacterium]|nr:GntR family transcriptional regulator [Chloroflexota bacterium]